MAFKNCGHKLLHLTHDSNNNRRDEERKMANVDTNNNKQQPELPHRQSHREREKETRSTAHITSPYKSSTTHKCTYYYTYMSVTATATTRL
jgi:hypothetical protein